MIFSPAPTSILGTGVRAVAAVRGRTQIRNVACPGPAGTERIPIEQGIWNVGLFLPHPLQLVQRLTRNGRNRDLTADEDRRDANLHRLVLLPSLGEGDDFAANLDGIDHRRKLLDALVCPEHFGGEQLSHLLHHGEVVRLPARAPLEQWVDVSRAALDEHDLRALQLPLHRRLEDAWIVGRVLTARRDRGRRRARRSGR